jgi:hypothetical protein
LALTERLKAAARRSPPDIAAEATALGRHSPGEVKQAAVLEAYLRGMLSA